MSSLLSPDGYRAAAPPRSSRACRRGPRSPARRPASARLLPRAPPASARHGGDRVAPGARAFHHAGGGAARAAIGARCVTQSTWRPAARLPELLRRRRRRRARRCRRPPRRRPWWAHRSAARQDGLEREHRARQLAARGDLRASGRSSSPGFADRRNSTRSSPRAADPRPLGPRPGSDARARTRVLHAERAELALRSTAPSARQPRARFRELVRRRRTAPPRPRRARAPARRELLVALQTVERPAASSR